MFFERMVRTIWKLTAENLINNKIPLKLYESQRSSLRVALADVQGPMVHGTLSFGIYFLLNFLEN